MKRICKIANLILIMLTFSYGQNKMEPVTNFKLDQYLGKWYEIARLPAKFEKNLIKVTANYSLKQNGKVKIENQGIDIITKKNKIAIGKAKFARSTDVGYLKVSFFGPFYGDYKIIELDKDYQYAIVMSSNKYLWILSRTPKLDQEILNKLLEKAKEAEIDTNKLYFAPQENG
jgi:apolipoprotein D and lipocalin family protein